jgi:hypothetical protein
MNNEKNKINFFNKYYFLTLILIMLLSFIYLANNLVACTEFIELNEELLRDECDVTIDEYYAILTIDEEFCPEAQEFEGTECNYQVIIFFILTIFVIYNMMYIILFMILKQKTQNSKEKLQINKEEQKTQEKKEKDIKKINEDTNNTNKINNNKN